MEKTPLRGGPPRRLNRTHLARQAFRELYEASNGTHRRPDDSSNFAPRSVADSRAPGVDSIQTSASHSSSLSHSEVDSTPRLAAVLLIGIGIGRAPRFADCGARQSAIQAGGRFVPVVVPVPVSEPSPSPSIRRTIDFGSAGRMLAEQAEDRSESARLPRCRRRLPLAQDYRNAASAIGCSSPRRGPTPEAQDNWLLTSLKTPPSGEFTVAKTDGALFVRRSCGRRRSAAGCGLKLRRGRPKAATDRSTRSAPL